MFDATCHPYTWATLMQDPVFVALFVRAQPNSGSPIRTGYMGSLLRCNIYVGSNVRSYSTATADSKTAYSMTFFGAEAYGMAGVGSLVPDYQGGFGAGEYDNNSGKGVKPVEIIVKALGETGLDPLNQRGTVGWKATHVAAILQILSLVDLEHATVFST
jgi:N4-gp56 family major capsid protein